MQHSLKEHYERDGYLTQMPIISAEEAAAHRAELENIETKHGSMHYQFKIHTVMRSPYELATHPAMLDIVEQLLGPDILLYSVSYIIKEPHSASHVSWHQDLTYWGLSGESQVSAWLALSPATEQSGCMHMIPGSHKHGQRQHTLTDDDSNVLLNGQTITDVDSSQAKVLALQPGQASFHHGWTLHTSMPNRSDDRRIGLNIQYITPDLYQLKHSRDSALLVRGTDQYQHFQTDKPARQSFDDQAWDYQQQLNRELKAIQGDTRSTATKVSL